MPPPSFTTNPKLFETPAAYPLVQEVLTGRPGPFEHNGKLYWMVTEVPSLSAPNKTIVVYRSDNLGQSQPLVRISSGIFVANMGNGFSPSYPGSGNLIYGAYVDPSLSAFNGNIRLVTFDMSTETFGTPSDTGVTIDSTLICGQPIPVHLSNGKTQIIYDTNKHDASDGRLFSVQFDGVSSWSSPLLIAAIGSCFVFPFSLWAMAVANNRVGGWFLNPLSNVFTYFVVNGTTLESSMNITQTSTLRNNVPITGIYDAASDSCVCLVQMTGEEFTNLLVATPSTGTPVLSYVNVYTDTPDAFNYDTGVIVRNSSGTQFYVLMWAADPNLLHIFSSSTIGGPWVGPTTFYSQAANPPVPNPSGPEIFPVYAEILADGTLAVTAGFLYPVGGDPPFCGVLAALIIPAALSLACPVTNTGEVGVPFNATLIVTGGTPPFTFALISGSLPTGLSLNTATGVISGIPAAPGAFNFIVQVTDANGLTANTGPGGCTITITQMTLACPVTGTGQVGVPYSGSFVRTNGTGPFTYAIPVGTLPPGLTLNTSTGAITGTPTTVGTFVYTGQVTDSLGATATASCMFVVSPPAPPGSCPVIDNP